MLNRFIGWAKKNGWNISAAEEAAALPAHINERYHVHDGWYTFISKLKVCENSTATAWFLTPNDYLPHEGGFQWNEFELQSLEWCDGDENVKAFWDRHLPIVQSVDGGYSYFAIDTQSGNIVSGCEPEYEDAGFAADSFESFIEKLINGEIVL